MVETYAVLRVDNSDTEGKSRIKELKRAARNDSMGALWQIGEMLSLIEFDQKI